MIKKITTDKDLVEIGTLIKEFNRELNSGTYTFPALILLNGELIEGQVTITKKREKPKDKNGKVIVPVLRRITVHHITAFIPKRKKKKAIKLTQNTRIYK